MTKVRLTPWKNPNCMKTGDEKKRPIITCELKDYKNTIANMKNACELVSVGEKCCVYLDWDNKFVAGDCYGAPFYTPKYEMKSLKERLDEHLRKAPLFQGQPYTVLTRAPRPDGDKIKFSYRIIFNKLPTDDFTKIKDYLKSVGYEDDAPFDLKVYSSGALNGQLINSVYSTKPDCDLELTPLWQETDVSKMLITVVDDDLPLVDWSKWITAEPTIVLKKYEPLVIDDDGETNDDIDALMKDVVEHCSERRSDDYETWLGLCCAFLNVGVRFNMKRRAVNYFHEFSRKSKKYDEDKVDEIIHGLERSHRERGYGIAYLRRCLKEDAPSLFQEKYESSYTAVKKRMERDTFKVMNPVGFFRINNDTDIVGHTDYIQLLKRPELMTLYENVSYYGKNKKGESEKKDFTKDWLKDANIRTYKSIVFDPSNEANKRDYYNIFRGFRAELLPDVDVNDEKTKEGLALIRQHMREIYCNGNEEHFEWLENWLASPIQQPKVRTGVAVIFHGKQGVGKNMVLDAYANAILGEQCSYSTGSPAETVFGRFNSGLMNKMLLVCNEAGSSLYDVMDKLKDLLTSETINIEKKMKDCLTFPNYLSIMMTTNNTNPLFISKDDRRLVWFGCQSTKKGDVEYFKKLKTVLQDDNVIKAWYNHLKTMPMKYKTMVDFQENRPITIEYKRLQDLNVPSWMMWLCSYYSQMTFKQNNKRGNASYYCQDLKAMYIEYKVWCDNCKCESIKFKSFKFNMTTTDVGGETYQKGHVEWVAFEKLQFEKWLSDNRLTTTNDLPTAEDLGFDDSVQFDDSD